MMMKPKVFVLALFVIILAQGFAVQAQHMNAEDAPCRGPMSGAAETECFYKASLAADKKLNHVLRVVLTTVSGDEMTKLKASERIWLQFREANCLAERELYGGGSATTMVNYACLEAVTRNRTKELKTMYGWRIENWDKKF